MPQHVPMSRLVGGRIYDLDSYYKTQSASLARARELRRSRRNAVLTQKIGGVYAVYVHRTDGRKHEFRNDLIDIALLGLTGAVAIGLAKSI